MADMSTRYISTEEALDLAPGSEHYTAYVGPPHDYDVMGATQFRLLCALGLRAQHHLLDFGCGSLRAGRFLIPYLKAGHYCGIEPNGWLIEDAIEREIGADQVRIKAPRFLHHDSFDCSAFDLSFDYIVAQSIFSHCGADLVRLGLREFSANLEPQGLAVVTFVHPEPGEEPTTASGWIYPDCVSHTLSSVEAWISEASLHGCRIPWYHPWRQTWWILARDPKRLPSPEETSWLRGAVL